ncbi:flagellar basal-body rod protein FlgB [Cognatiyoonia koreensis]|uniref:Flagellar basal-body rod protein FlgB n=1 Tax=Cognatiyoonia koreensis TaxID=364200 RepID=A0A1I0RLI6_9RHOB|nr:FlgB family protein [Cognatiyoonia koreensis]SEW41232.1 flagellar basal-body rod protein FlgB [Cognatiyoonia koreensis]
MYQGLDLFNTAAAMARHAGARQALTARNVANADTPGYEARVMPTFAQTYGTSSDFTLRQSDARHMSAQTAHSRQVDLARTEPSPNGNTVSIEEEMLNAVAISREHNRALTIYRHAMTVLRTTLGR